MLQGMALSRRSLLRLGAVASGAAITGASAGNVASAAPLSNSLARLPGRNVGSSRALESMLDRLKPLTESGILPNNAGSLPGGSQFLSLRFPSGLGKESGGSFSKLSARLRYTCANSRQETITAHPTTHRRDDFSSPIGSEPIALPSDTVAVEFLDASTLHSYAPSAHIHPVGEATRQEFRGVATEPYAFNAQAAKGAMAGSSSAVQGSKDLNNQIN